MFNLKEYSGNYSKTSGSLWQYFRNDPALANGAIVDFPPANKNSASGKQELMLQKMLK